MARNRKRAKERRARQPQPAATPARGARGGNEAAPDPIAHATPDAELAEAQLSLGRPAPADEPADDLREPQESQIPGVLPKRPHVEQEADGTVEPDEAIGAGGGGGRRTGEDFGDEDFADGDGEGGELAAPRERHPAPAATGNRLINFLQGSWRELQRVQWPDRRQVMQATGVVIGFVIVAGAYLGVADALAGKIVDFILK
jgi:preprotein translocase subunit SecE